MKKIAILLSLIIILGIVYWSLQPKSTVDAPVVDQLGQPLIWGEDASIYEIDINNSVFNWSGSNSLSQKQHYGSINIKSGKLAVIEQQIVGGEFVIDMTSINNLNLEGSSKQKIEEHLSSEDFFAVSRFPESRFIITQVDKNEEQYYQLSGNLTIKDITNTLSFPTKIVLTDKLLTAQADFSLDRTNWGIKYGSNNFFENLGDKAIDDLISFQVSLQANLVE